MTGKDARAKIYPLSSYDASIFLGLSPASIRLYLNSDTVPTSFEDAINKFDVMDVFRYSRLSLIHI